MKKILRNFCNWRPFNEYSLGYVQLSSVYNGLHQRYCRILSVHRGVLNLWEDLGRHCIRPPKLHLRPKIRGMVWKFELCFMASFSPSELAELGFFASCCLNFCRISFNIWVGWGYQGKNQAHLTDARPKRTHVQAENVQGHFQWQCAKRENIPTFNGSPETLHTHVRTIKEQNYTKNIRR